MPSLFIDIPVIKKVYLGPKDRILLHASILLLTVFLLFRLLMLPLLLYSQPLYPNFVHTTPTWLKAYLWKAFPGTNPPTLSGWNVLPFCIARSPCDYHLYCVFLMLIQIKLFIYLFLAALGLSCCTQAFSSCEEQGLLSSCSAQVSYCGDFSCCRTWTLGIWASVAAVHRLSCSAACGILLEKGLNLCPLHGQVDSPPLDYQGSPLFCYHLFSHLSSH